MQYAEYRGCGSGRTNFWGEFACGDRGLSSSNPSANLVSGGRQFLLTGKGDLAFYDPSITTHHMDYCLSPPAESFCGRCAFIASQDAPPGAERRHYGYILWYV